MRFLLPFVVVGVFSPLMALASAASSFYGVVPLASCSSFYGLLDPSCAAAARLPPPAPTPASSPAPPSPCVDMYGPAAAPFPGTWNGTHFRFSFRDPPAFFRPLANTNTSLLRYINVFGVPLLCSEGFDPYCEHTANLLAGTLDNDGDGCADDLAVLTRLTSFFVPSSPARRRLLSTNQAHPVICAFPTAYAANVVYHSRLEAEGLALHEGCEVVDFSRTHPMCGGLAAGLNNCVDGTFERVLAFVTQRGLAPAYPAVWGLSATQAPPSSAALLTDAARGGRFTGAPPRPYPPAAIYTSYYHYTCDYACHITKLVHWALTTLKGGSANKVGYYRWQPVNLTNETHVYPVYTQAQCDAAACNGTCGHRCSEWQPRYRADVLALLPGAQALFETDAAATTLFLFSPNGTIPLGTYHPSTISLWTPRQNADGTPARHVPRPLPASLTSDGAGPKPGAGTRRWVEQAIVANERRLPYEAERILAYANAPLTPGHLGPYMRDARATVPALLRRRLGDVRPPEHEAKPFIFPTITAASPVHGPTLGGTRITVRGGPFRALASESVAAELGPGMPPPAEQVSPGSTASASVRLRFSMQGRAPVSVGALEIRASDEAVFETPPSPRGAGIAQLTVSTDGGQTYSHVPLATVQGGGTFLFFEYVEPLPPNMLVNYSDPNRTHVQLSLSIDNTTGPFVGGTLLTVTLGCVPPPWVPPPAEPVSFYGIDGLVDAPPPPPSPPPPSPPPPPPSPPPHPPPPPPYPPFSPPPPEPPYPEIFAALGLGHSLGTYYGLTSYIGDGYPPHRLKRTVDPCARTRAILNWTTPFLPSKHLRCQIATFANPQNGTNHTDEYFRRDVVPAEYVSPTQIRCHTPPVLGSRSDRTVNATAHVSVSNDGVTFTDAGFAVPFVYTNNFPEILHIFTKADASNIKARGPMHGRTEIFINGTGFLPSESLRAKLTMDVPASVLASNPTVRALSKVVPCWFDHATQVRCVSPEWSDGIESARGTANTQELSTFAPGFQVSVDLSNDGGIRYSLPNKDRFLYADLYVSGSGSDIFGDGTRRFGFRSINRAIQAALSEPRSFHVGRQPFANASTLEGFIAHRYRAARNEKHARGLGNYLNSDRIVLQDGTYSNLIGLYGYEQNALLIPHRKLIAVTAENRGGVTIRCASTATDSPQHPYGTRGEHDFDAESHGALSLEGISVSGCNPTLIYETYDTKRRPWNDDDYGRVPWHRGRARVPDRGG